MFLNIHETYLEINNKKMSEISSYVWKVTQF